MKSCRRTWGPALLLCALACSPAAVCAAVDDRNVTVFATAWFADAHPQTAFDMVTRLPGFSFDGGSDDVRGYAGSTGNVLIDGEWPASKYDDLEDILKRISAASVTRIELVRGPSSTIDMHGHLVVANVVREASAIVDASTSLGWYLHGDGRRLPEWRLKASHRQGEKLIQGSLQVYKLADDESGSGYRRQLTPGGEVVESAGSTLLAEEAGVRATLGLERPLFGGRLRLSGALDAAETDQDEAISANATGIAATAITEEADERQAELGVHFDRSIGQASRLQLMAIHHRLESDAAERESSGDGSETFRAEADAGETIARATLQTALSPTTTFEWGAEAAFNFLESTAAGEIDGAPVLLPAADLRVEERRAEPFVRASWRIHPGLDLEAGAATEFSRISLSGDNRVAKSLTYPKPHVALTWSPSAKDRLQVRLQREVGQLDFGDFVSSAELATETLNVGNPDLEPWTSWDLIGNWQRELWEEGAIVLRLRHSRISDVIDIAPIFADTDGDGITEVFEGPANIGDGRLSEVEVGLTLPLARLGITGGLFKGNLVYRHSSVADPLTGQRRSIADSGQLDTEYPWTGALEFTQDLPAWHSRWGVQLKLGESERAYRPAETREETEHAWIGVFGEYFPAPGWAVALELQNLTSRGVRLVRRQFDQPRNAGSVIAVADQWRRFDPYVYLRVRWQIR